MRCVKCDEPIARFDEPCSHCQFHGNVALVEELEHVRWLLSQVDVLNKLGIRTLRLSQHYTARQREIEIQLGLRLAKLTPAQARGMYLSLVQHTTLLERIDTWLVADWLNRENIQPILAETRDQIRDLRRQLADTPPASALTNAERITLIDFLLQAIERIDAQNGFASADTKEHAHAALIAEKEKLEIKLGLRKPQPVVAIPKPPEQLVAPIAEPTPPAPPPPPSTPKQPLPDRFWRTFLSERTLQAMLFLGIFLLFAAAISFVFWGWQDFSAPLRVAIPTVFTLIFIALGWYVRVQTRMHRSGIALTAIAALLIPIDFYTLYINFQVPPEYTSAFWLFTSIVCLAAYIVITLLTQSWIFGYLVGAAAGSIVMSLVDWAHQLVALPLDWNAGALSILIIALMLIATELSRAKNPGRWRVMAEPFRNLALIAVSTLMLLSFGVRFIDRRTYDALHYSMTLSWWCGGFLFGWGAIHYRSRTLGILAAITLPIATFFTQAAIFDSAHINLAWHAFGLALLVPIYLTVGNRLLAIKDDKILLGHGRTATGWGIVLTVVAAIWSLTNLTNSFAAMSTHAVLCGAMVLAMFLWRQPRILYAASFFALTATAFAMSELNLSPNQFSIGWSSLAIAYIVFAVVFGSRIRSLSEFGNRLLVTLVDSGFIVAALAIVSAFLPYDGERLAYALGNWLALSAWSSRLAYTQQPGFVSQGWFGRSRFHWLTVLPLPIWIWVLFANRGPLGHDLPLALSVLAWGMVALRLSLRGAQATKQSPSTTSEIAPSPNASRLLAMTPDLPWYSIGLLISIIAPIAALFIDRNGYTPALCLVAAGLLYFADAITNRQRWELVPGSLVTAWGWTWLLNRAGVSFDAATFSVAVLIGIYFFAGLWQEHQRSTIFTQKFLKPMYWANHALTFFVLLRIANTPFASLLYRSAWTDEMRLWQAASCILLGIVYAFYAWGTFKERWAHAATWLFVAGGGLVAISYSTGTGSLAARAAFGAIVCIIAERILFWLRRGRATQVAATNAPSLPTQTRKFIRLAWRLYRRALLFAGWVTSIAVIGIALVRNLILLGGGRTPQIWAVIGLTMIVALYALSARTFRLARFVWFAAFLSFIPWTIMTNLGWLVADRPKTAAFAISWIVLAWLAYTIHLLVRRFAPASYAFPLRLFAHLLAPFALLWGVADAPTSRITFILAIAFYALEAFRDARRLKIDATVPSLRRYTVFLYPALGLVPVWCVYLLNLFPGSRFEHFGLMLLTFGILGLVAGQSLERFAPRRELANYFGLPAYLTGYVATMVGTLLTAHDASLLTLVLVYDSLLALVSARLFKNPMWAFVSAAIAPFAFWLALNQSGIPGNRHGWWLIALAAIYLLMAWTLRRARLASYSTAPLTIAFALIAFALPPSSQDKVGAFWGYGSAAILYAITALWLRQPLLLTPVCALVLVPYAIGLQETQMPSEYYGLAFFPGSLVALIVASVLDARLGTWLDFPWSSPLKWFIALAERLLNWWALPFYVLGFGLVAASPFFANGKLGFSAFNCLLAMPIFAWAIYRFRLRVWAFATAIAGHGAVFFYLYDLGWRRFPADLALRFLPVTIITAIVALVIARRRNEAAPTNLREWKLNEWSHPLYLLVMFDFIGMQILGFADAHAGMSISFVHALLFAMLASFWISRTLPFISTILGFSSLLQWMTTQDGPRVNAPIPFAILALGYGLVGYGLLYASKRRALPTWLAIWNQSLRSSAIFVSFVVIILALAFGFNITQWTVRALLGMPFRQIVDLITAQMIVDVLALLGLLYLTASFAHRRTRAGYLSIAMLLASWMVFAFYVQIWDGAPNLQWYALPAGIYLLGISFLEWRNGNRNFARWIDYAAVVLMMGSLFWQTLLFGWTYALMLGAEGFATIVWGAARRLRRLFYAGVMGVILATVAQLINSLQSINQWLVFGIIGLLVVGAAIFIERKIEDIRQTLEAWE